MRIVSRANWGAKPPRSSPTASKQTTVTFHWEGPHMGDYSPDESPGIVRSIQRFHMDTRQWNDIAYNFLVDRYGVIFEGRGRNIYNAASGTSHANSTSFAICYIGGQNDPFTDEAKQSMRALALDLGGKVYGHRDWVSTECPGNEILNWARAGMPVSNTPPVQPPPKPPTSPVPPFQGGPYGRDCRRFTCEGAGVTVIQRRLQQLGHVLAADGDFGPITEREVKQHQEAEGIPVDGIVGPQTWHHMWT